MKKNNNYFCIVNSSIIILMILYIILYHDKLFIIPNIKYILILTILFSIIHLLRIIRQYIILMETKIKAVKLIKTYFVGSLMNNIAPYKIGEIYKMYLYGHIIHNNKKSIIGIITDKFFDAVVLLIAFMIIEIKSSNSLSYITMFLLAIVITIVAVYISFEKTYKLLNNYLMINKKTKFSIKCLKILDDINEMYNMFKSMIKDREILIFLLTLLSWFFEIIFVYIIYMMRNSKFIVSNFIKYVNNSFFGMQNELSNYYLFVTLIIGLAYVCILGVYKIFNYKSRSRYEEINNNI